MMFVMWRGRVSTKETVVKLSDRLTHEQRRKNMKAVKSRQTALEIMLCSELERFGIVFERNPSNVYGNPDIVFLESKVAVFCDGEFWHGYNWPEASENIKSNREFWLPKIEKNIKRDREVTQTLRDNGWKVLRFWGKDIKSNAGMCAVKIINEVRECLAE